MTEVTDAKPNLDLAELQSIADRVADELDEMKAKSERISAILKTAKSLGYDPKAIKKLIALRDETKRLNFQKELDTLRAYSEALGEGDPVGDML